MNESIDLTKILENCPEGTKLWSDNYGIVYFMCIDKSFDESVLTKLPDGYIATYTKQGWYTADYPANCLLWPSKDCRDWSKFTAPWYKKETSTIDTIEKQDEQASLQTNERAWLYLISDVLTWKDGIGQYLDDPRVQELAKKLCSKYSQKLYNPSNTEKDEQKSADKIEPKFKVGDWIASNLSNSSNLLCIIGVDETNYEVVTPQGSTGVPFIMYIDKHYHLWTIQDANDGDVIRLGTVTAIFKKYIGQEECICYCSFYKDGSFEIPIENGEDNVYGCYNATPVTKEQCDSFMKIMNDAGYEWDAKKKELNKKEKFDPKTLQPFDRVLVRDYNDDKWVCSIFSHIEAEDSFHCECILELWKCCIPYNDDTKHLVGTTEEAPEYYRYWED